MTPPTEDRIDPGLSLFLDVLRFGAALLVVFSHLSTRWLGGGWLWQAGKYGDPAVMIFFVLSGFVIAATTDRDRGAGAYVVARLSRLYSVVLPALIVTALLDFLGARFNPDFYYAVSPAARPFDIASDAGLRYLASAGFVQEWWSVSLALPWPGSDNPFWSLSYEATYYAAFGFALFTRGAVRIAALLLLAVLAGPTILALFPIWLMGVAIYRARSHFSPANAWPLLAAGAAAMLLCLYFRADLRAMGAALPVLESANLVMRYAVGLSVSLVILGVSLLPGRSVAERIAAPVRRVADHTFELYLLHVPVAVFLAATLPGKVDQGWRIVALYLGVALATIAVARFTLPLKAAMRRAGTRFLRPGELRWIK